MPDPFQPLFAHKWVHVTREAARDVAHAFNSLVARGEDRVRARRFILQCVVAMFAEDFGLLPQDLFTHLLDECRRGAGVGTCLSRRTARGLTPVQATMQPFPG